MKSGDVWIKDYKKIYIIKEEIKSVSGGFHIDILTKNYTRSGMLSSLNITDFVKANKKASEVEAAKILLGWK